MKWTDAEDIGIALQEKFPDIDPLTVRFTDLRERVIQLDGFDDDPKTSLDEARAWEGHTLGGSTLRVFPGGHFYLTDRAADVLAVLTEHFTATVSRGA